MAGDGVNLKISTGLPHSAHCFENNLWVNVSMLIIQEKRFIGHFCDTQQNL
jgi:hypothetical protein